MKKRWMTLCLTLAMCLGLAVTPASAADSGPTKSDNLNAQNYTTWSKPVTSYLYENEAGGLTRVEYISGQIVAEDYSPDFQYLTGRTIPMELSIWGGFYAGEDCNFLVFGQANPEESDSAEVIRVVKYSKDWQRLGQASLRGANTTVPFDAGSLRMDEYGGYLYIRTCHEMYTSSDGLNHQANLTMAVRQSDMEITDAYYDVMNSSFGYVSHSFNQFILVDEEGRIVALDHGDAYPRAMTFMRYYADAGSGRFTGSGYGAWCSVGEQRKFAGAVGNNTTGSSVGGLAETSQCYMMAYNYDGAGGSGPRSVYLQAMDIATGKGKDYQITRSGDSTTPVLALTGLDGGYLLWNTKEGYTVRDTLCYLHYGADGVPDQIVTTTGALSDCAPVYYNGQVVWYVTDNSAPVFYTLDESGVTRHGGSPVEPEQTQEPGQTQEPEQPKETQQSQQPAPDFSDVPASFWGSAYIRKAAQAGLMTGTGDESFDPNGSLTQAQTMVLAYQLHSQANGGTLPQTSGAWYMPYYQYCVDNGLLTGRFDPDDLNQTASRFDMVAILDKAIPAGRMAAETSVPDGAIPDLDEDDAYGDLVYRWYRAGIVSGDSEGRFNGDSGITRAETAVILCQINGLA